MRIFILNHPVDEICDRFNNWYLGLSPEAVSGIKMRFISKYLPEDIEILKDTSVELSLYNRARLAILDHNYYHEVIITTV